jgi:hypothetical protein
LSALFLEEQLIGAGTRASATLDEVLLSSISLTHAGN